MIKNFFITSKLQKKINESKNPNIPKHFTNKTRLYLVPGIFDGPYRVEKDRIHGRPTFLWQRITYGDRQVLYVLRDFFASHDEYISKNQGGRLSVWGEKNPVSSEEEKEIKEYIYHLLLNTEKIQYKDLELEPLNNCERLFLDNPVDVTTSSFLITIFETEKWVKQRSEKQYSSNLASAILKFVERSDVICNKLHEGLYIIPNPQDNRQNVAAYFIPQSNVEDSSDLVLLGTVSEGANVEELFAEAIKNPLELKRNCRRVYPYDYLDDTDLWQEMEKDPNSNFILSEEERDIVLKNKVFPLFISGRAGSGKSTVLQYKFAELVIRYLKYEGYSDENLFVPAYISYSKDLIDDAKKMVESLLTKNHLYQSEVDKIIKEKGLSREQFFNNILKPLLENECFWEFENLLKETIRLRDEEILSNYIPENKITYVRFRSMWEEKHGKNPQFKKISPNLVWHIIQTYIKGWDASSYLKPEAYEKIGFNNQTAQISQYKIVYEKIWLPWYSKLREEQGLWDSQDLAREALKVVSPMFSGVLCDEAQDFTRVELEFLIKINVFSYKKLEVKEISKIPFVFAGDVFQTLSPTAFSWDTLSSASFEKLTQALGMKIPELPELVELLNNYRSTPNIVKLGNVLQLLRESRCGQSSKPQKTYFGDNGSPVYTLKNDKEVWDRLKNKKVVVILPVEDGQSVREYVETTPELKDKIEFNAKGYPEIDILTPAQAKGLGFPQVALFGFGLQPDLTPKKLLKWLQSEHRDPLPENIDQEIRIKYDLNNAYVAATRAKNRLFIIDDKVEDSLWGIAISTNPLYHDIQKAMLDNLSQNGKSNWEENERGAILGQLIAGSHRDITDENLKDQPQQLLDREKAAYAAQNPNWLEQIASGFLSMGDNKSNARCLAKASLLKGDYFAAAKEFMNAGMPSEAIDNFWKSLDKLSNYDNHLFQEIIDNLSSLSTEVEFSEPVDLANQLKKCSEIQDVIMAITTILSKQNNDSKARILMADYLLEHLPERLLDPTKEDLEGISRNVIAKIEEGWSLRADKLIKLLEEKKAYDMAVNLGEKTSSKSPSFYKAQVKSKPFPESVKFFSWAYGDKASEKIYESFKEYSGDFKSHIKPESRHLIANAIVEYSKDQKELTDAFAYLLADAKADSLEKLRSLMKKKGFGRVLKAVNFMTALREENLNDIEKYGIDLPEEYTRLADEFKKLLKNGKFSDSQEFEIDRNVKSFFIRHYSGVNIGLAIPLLLLLGRMMEARRNKSKDFKDEPMHINSVRFYEWAIENKALKEDIHLLELLLFNEWKKMPTNKDKEEVIFKKKLDLGIDISADSEALIQEEKVMAWERLYARILNNNALHGMNDRDDEQIPDAVSAEISDHQTNEVRSENNMHFPKTEDVIEINNPIMTENHLNETLVNSVISKSKSVEKTDTQMFSDAELLDFKQVIDNRFEIIYLFERKKLEIKYLTGKASVYINKGKIFGDGDLDVTGEGRLIFKDTEFLPLSVKIIDDEITVEWLSLDGVSTGVYFCFPVK